MHNITEPFDPSLIEVEVKNTTIATLVQMLENGMVDMQPAFQRFGNVWKLEQKSCLIESVLLGLPLPSFYFLREKGNGKWIIIDGLQRLTTLKEFCVEKTLRLKGLDYLQDRYEGLRFDDLEKSDRLNFNMQSVTLNILHGSTPSDVKYILFKRINSAGTQLKPQEIRNALYQGTATKLLNGLVDHPVVENVLGKIDKKRMERQEYLLRFFAFYLYDYSTDHVSSLDAFLSKSMDRINKEVCEDEISRLETSLTNALELCSNIFGDNVFKNPKNEGKKLISKALFDAVSVNIAKLRSTQQTLLTDRKDKLASLYNNLFDNSAFQKSLLSGTGQKAKIATRFSAIHDIIQKTLDDAD